MEVRELTVTILTHLDELENASTSWIRNTEIADRQVEQAPDHDQGLLVRASESQVQDQTRLFDVLEAFLASWARLSLLLFPLTKSGIGSDFTKARGEGIRNALGVDVNSAFANRDLRDAWMHFDERLDAAVSGGTFGSRHRFVRSERAGDYVDNTLRLVEVDTLVVRYLDRRGQARAVDLRTAKQELLDIDAAAGRAMIAG